MADWRPLVSDGTRLVLLVPGEVYQTRTGEFILHTATGYDIPLANALGEVTAVGKVSRYLTEDEANSLGWGANLMAFPNSRRD